MQPEYTKFLRVLNEAYGCLQNTYIKLLEDGKDSEAEKMDDIILSMSALIEDLTNDALEDWLSKAKKLENKSQALLDEVSGFAKSIEKDMSNAEKLIKGMSSLDKALAKLFKVLA